MVRESQEMVMTTDITTNNTASGLSCIFTQRIIAAADELLDINALVCAKSQMHTF